VSSFDAFDSIHAAFLSPYKESGETRCAPRRGDGEISYLGTTPRLSTPCRNAMIELRISCSMNTKNDYETGEAAYAAVLVLFVAVFGTSIAVSVFLCLRT
jgi:hypothetical protein